MAYFKINRFKGIAPAVSPRLLAEGIGQTAQNVDLESGRLVPISNDLDAFSSTTSVPSSIDLASTTKNSIYVYNNDNWMNNFTNATNVDLLDSPVINDGYDRIYWTGDVYPKMSHNTSILGGAPYPSANYRLGVPAPAAAPSLGSTSGTADSGAITNDVSYVSTLVSSAGEEGPPSAATTAQSMANGQSIVVTTATSPPTHATGSGNYNFVGVPPKVTVTRSGSNTISSITVDNPAGNGHYVSVPTVSFSGGGGSSAAATAVLTNNKVTSVTVDTAGSGYTSDPDVSFTTAIAGTKRIYRSNTGSTNTEFQFLVELPITTAAYTDSIDADALGEILPSTTWIGPPDDDPNIYPNGQMLGLTFIANGVFAGFSGRMLCFSEPFLPHAWPADYRLTLEDNIVGLGVTANGIAVVTEGPPYFVGGTDPASMTAIKLDSAQACLNKNSIVDMGDYVLYAGPDGLVAISGNDVQIVSKGVISPEQWKDAAGTFRPAAISAFRYKETYVAFDLSSSTGWVYDPKGQENMFTTLASASAIRGGYEDKTNGDLYLIVGDNIFKYREGTSTQTLIYKSGKFVTPAPTSMQYVSVDAVSFATDAVVIKVYGDDTLISNYSLVLYKETIATSAVNTSTEVITISAHGFETGASVTYSNGGGTTLAGLSNDTEYFVISASTTTIKLASTRANAFAGTAINLTGTGNNAQTLTSGNLLQQSTTTPSGISTKAYLQEPIMRLPATIAQEWEVQIETKQTINDVCIAQSIDEIRAT